MVVRDVVTVDGTTFFHARKTDSALIRAFTGSTWGKKRPLKDSNVFENIARLRDSAIECLAAPAALVHLDLDGDDQPRKKTKVYAEFVMIDLPPVGCVSGVRAKVLTRRSLFLECSSEVVNWLAASFAENQILDGDDEDASGGCNDDGDADPADVPKYISFDKGRKAYKVRYRNTVKWFSKHKSDDPLGDAKSFLNNLLECSNGQGQC